MHFEQEAQKLLHGMPKMGEQGKEKGHPAQLMRLSQPVSLHVLSSNTVTVCVTEHTGGLCQNSDTYKREAECTDGAADKRGD